MSTLRETCHCGHDKASHYRDETVRPAVLRACLCTGCECKAYADANGPAPKKPVTRPNHTSICRCYRCKEWLAQQEVPPAADTLRGLP